MEQSSHDNDALAEEIRQTLGTDIDTRPAPRQPYQPPAFAFAPEPYAVREAHVAQERLAAQDAELARMDDAIADGYLRIEAEQAQIDAIVGEKTKLLEARAATNRYLADLSSADRQPVDPVATIENARRPRRPNRKAAS